ncbi:hypothetical protein NL676_038597 [Syzygium grande]|nr:hypothetical protein NL676_038597 [Syzygium grande]
MRLLGGDKLNQNMGQRHSAGAAGGDGPGRIGVVVANTTLGRAWGRRGGARLDELNGRLPRKPCKGGVVVSLPRGKREGGEG